MVKIMWTYRGQIGPCPVHTDSKWAVKACHELQTILPRHLFPHCQAIATVIDLTPSARGHRLDECFDKTHLESISNDKFCHAHIFLLVLYRCASKRQQCNGQPHITELFPVEILEQGWMNMRSQRRRRRCRCCRRIQNGRQDLGPQKGLRGWLRRFMNGRGRSRGWNQEDVRVKIERYDELNG